MLLDNVSGTVSYDWETNALPFSMFFFNSGKHASKSFSSSADKEPRGWIFSTPLG